MMKKEPAISFRVYWDVDVHTIFTYPGEYRSLMDLLYDKLFLEDFGECRGMGRCGTCLIEIVSSAQPLTLLDRNETATLEKMEITGASIHLSCQVLVDKALHDAEIKIQSE